LEPPEDKLAAASEPAQREEIKIKLPSYMTELEGSRNPAVSPFSYSPRVI